MAIKSNYYFKGINIADAYIRIDRLWGSSKENWTALVGVYNLTEETVPAVPAVDAVLDEEGNIVTPAVEGIDATTKTVYNLIEDFNHSCNYDANERGYVSLYNSLKEKFSNSVDC